MLDGEDLQGLKLLLYRSVHNLIVLHQRASLPAGCFVTNEIPFYCARQAAQCLLFMLCNVVRGKRIKRKKKEKGDFSNEPLCASDNTKVHHLNYLLFGFYKIQSTYILSNI